MDSAVPLGLHSEHNVLHKLQNKVLNLVLSRLSELKQIHLSATFLKLERLDLHYKQQLQSMAKRIIKMT